MRRVVLLVYSLVFVNELSQAALIPLLPTFAREFGLSDVETGAMLGAMMLATVVVAVPIGMCADRIGPRRLTVGAAGLIAVSSLVLAFAPSFPFLVVGRALYGIAFATVWTAGLGLISAATTGRRAGAIGGTIAVGGLAHFVGPIASGFLAEHFGLATPFLIIAGLAVILAVVLALVRVPAVERPRREQLRAALRAVRQHAELKTAMIVMALLGCVGGVVPLLVPLLLDENGLSPGEIGAVFSAGAAAWVLASSVAARESKRTVRVVAAGVGVLALASVLLLPALTAATVGIAAFVVLRATTQAPLSTISYPLAEAAARVSGIGAATVIGLTNLVWGAAATISPIAGGALADGIGPRATFALIAFSGALAGAWILIGSRRERARVEACETA